MNQRIELMNLFTMILMIFIVIFVIMIQKSTSFKKAYENTLTEKNTS